MALLLGCCSYLFLFRSSSSGLSDSLRLAFDSWRGGVGDGLFGVENGRLLGGGDSGLASGDGDL